MKQINCISDWQKECLMLTGIDTSPSTLCLSGLGFCGSFLVLAMLLKCLIELLEDSSQKFLDSLQIWKSLSEMGGYCVTPHILEQKDTKVLSV